MTGSPIAGNPEVAYSVKQREPNTGVPTTLSVAAYAAENDDGSVVESMEPAILERVAHPPVQQTPRAVEEASKNGVFQRAAPESAASGSLSRSHYAILYDD